MAVGLARVTGGIGRARDRDEEKAVLAGYVTGPRVRTHDSNRMSVGALIFHLVHGRMRP